MADLTWYVADGYVGGGPQTLYVNASDYRHMSDEDIAAALEDEVREEFQANIFPEVTPEDMRAAIREIREELAEDEEEEGDEE